MISTVLIGYSKTTNKRSIMNILLKMLCSVSEKPLNYCSKSYTDGFVAVVIGNKPVSCDTENLENFKNNERLTKKLRFFTDEHSSTSILSSTNPSFMAAKLWTRKECVYKFFNVRNLFSPSVLFNSEDVVFIDENVIYTYMIFEGTILSFMCSAGCTNINLYELIGDELYEKL